MSRGKLRVMPLPDRWPGETWAGPDDCPHCGQHPGMPHDCDRPQAATFKAFNRACKEAFGDIHERLRKP